MNHKLIGKTKRDNERTVDLLHKGFRKAPN